MYSMYCYIYSNEIQLHIITSNNKRKVSGRNSTEYTMRNKIERYKTLTKVKSPHLPRIILKNQANSNLRAQPHARLKHLLDRMCFQIYQLFSTSPFFSSSTSDPQDEN